MIPQAKRAARRADTLLRRVTRQPRRHQKPPKPQEKVIDSREQLYAFWRQAEPPGVNPRSFIAPVQRSAALAQVIADLPKSARILEVGCGAGRNLAYLHDHGYHNVEGVDISSHAVDLLRSTYPQLADVPVHVGPAEEELAKLPEDGYDLVFTMAFIEHLHPDSHAVFDEMVRLSKVIVAVEPPGRSSHRQYPHDVRKIFEARGLRVVSARPMSEFPGLAADRSIQPYTAWRFRGMDGVGRLHEFWRTPAPQGNNPHDYIGPVGRSEVLLELISDLPKDARILEVGCNVGRNLAYLFDHGYQNVEGVEISSHAVELLRSTYPQLADRPVHLGAAEEVLPGLPDEYDLVYTMAVLEHIHPDSAVVFDQIVRLGRSVLSIEPPGRLSHRQYPHDIPKIFEARGLELVSTRPMADFPSTATDAGIKMFYAWRFARPQ
jgi:SAM-dependent methyltransferase